MDKVMKFKIKRTNKPQKVEIGDMIQVTQSPKNIFYRVSGFEGSLVDKKKTRVYGDRVTDRAEEIASNIYLFELGDVDRLISIGKIKFLVSSEQNRF